MPLGWQLQPARKPLEDPRDDFVDLLLHPFYHPAIAVACSTAWVDASKKSTGHRMRLMSDMANPRAPSTRPSDNRQWLARLLRPTLGDAFQHRRDANGREAERGQHREGDNVGGDCFSCAKHGNSSQSGCARTQGNTH